jgi:hypothetical protein
LGATYGPVTILCALVDLQVKQSVVTKRHAWLSEQGEAWALPDFDRSVNPIKTKEQIMPTKILVAHRSSDLLTALTLYAASWLL